MAVLVAHFAELLAQELDGLGVVLVVEQLRALRAPILEIGRLLEIDADAPGRADVEVPLIIDFLLEALLVLVKLLLVHVLLHVSNALPVECPIGDIPSLLPILFPVVGHQVLVVEPIEDIAHFVDVLVDFFSDLEIRNVLFVLQVLDDRQAIFPNCFGDDIIYKLLCEFLCHGYQSEVSLVAIYPTYTPSSTQWIPAGYVSNFRTFPLLELTCILF